MSLIRNCAVILPAAGNSTRFGGPTKKPFLALNEKPIWLRSLQLFLSRPEIAQTLLVVAPDDLDDFKSHNGAQLAFLEVDLVAGGSERFESIANALAQLRDEIEFVAVHDAVRPLTGSKTIDAVLHAASEFGAAVPAVPVADTLKRVDDQMIITETPSREGLWLAQTPQIARRDWIDEAYRRRGELTEPITDDTQLLAAIGHPVRVVPGEVTNLKITTPEDLLLAEAILASREGATSPPTSRRPFDDDWE